MIYPSRIAILSAVAGAPVALLVALVMPERWYAALAWPLALLALTIIDALAGARPGQARARLDTPGHTGVGADFDVTLHVAIDGHSSKRGAPTRAQFALGYNETLESDEPDEGEPLWLALEDGTGAAIVPLRTRRRGMGRIDRLWLRWKGPLGLVWKQRVLALDTKIAILPDLRPVHDKGAQIFQRHALQGLMAQVDRGDGSDFDALVEFRSGMDKRALDWKQSARHVKLHAKEYRTERNNQLMFAIDCGRQMCEPIAGVARLDRVISAMLLTAWVALKLGDRVGFHTFDSQPRIASGLVSGVAAFGELRRHSAEIEYSGDETNYSHALATLSAQLTRRSMIILFTEFTDPTSAEFLVRSAARLVETHLLLVVVLRDQELEAILDQAPDTADDITRAVTASALLRDRAIVLTRLRHLGVQVIESEYDRVPDRLVQAYTDLKRRNLL